MQCWTTKRTACVSSLQIPSFHPQPTTCWEALHSPNERQAFWANLPATDESRQELEDSMLNHYLNVFGAGATVVNCTPLLLCCMPCTLLGMWKYAALQVVLNACF